MLIFLLKKMGVALAKATHMFFQQNTCELDIVLTRTVASLGGSVNCRPNWRPGGRGFDPRRGQQHSFMEIDHEIFSTVILTLPLIQEGQLSVSGERMCTVLVNRLED